MRSLVDFCSDARAFILYCAPFTVSAIFRSCFSSWRQGFYPVWKAQWAYAPGDGAYIAVLSSDCLLTTGGRPLQAILHRGVLPSVSSYYQLLYTG